MKKSTKYRLGLVFVILAISILQGECFKAKGQDKPAQNTQEEQKNKPENKKKKKSKENPEEIGNRDVGKGVNLYSIEKEIAIGKSIAQEIEKSAKLIDDPVISEYINRIGQNLVRNSDSKVPFTIKVIDSEDINAFALPGGFFFVNSGLILKAESEAELAGVMAHEIAHVAARHGTRQATQGQIANLASIPLIFLGGWGGFGARQAAGILVPMGFLRFKRVYEREADLLGLQYLYKTGYDPNALIDFFERIKSMEKRKPGTLSKLFSTHPLTSDRIKQSQKDIQNLLTEKWEYVVNTSEFIRIKESLNSMLNKRKGVEDDGRPSLRRKHGSDKIEVPTDKESKDKEDEPPVLKRR